jgi:Ca-activated chloride channel family protein
MKVFRFAAVLALGTSTALIALLQPLSAAEVKLDADLGQSVLQSGRSGKVYLRLSLKTLIAQESDRERRTPVNVALVLDRSGSMQGERIAAAREAARMALARLGREDIVALVAYNHNVDVLQRAERLTSHERLASIIDGLQAGGTTALYAGVEQGGREVKEYLSDNKINRVILMSDGLANVGPSTPKELGELGRKLGSEGISVTTIGFGLEYNEDLMQRLAAASDGNHAFAEKPEDLLRIFNSEFGDALSVSAKDITITIECKLGFKPIRLLGREGTISGSRITLKINQLQADSERYVVAELEAPNDQRDGAADIADVSVSYLDLDRNARAEADAKVEARFSKSESEAEASLNKAVMSQVSAQIATEENERAVELRDKGDIAGARKLLEDNAANIGRLKDLYASGAAPAPAASVKQLDELEKKNREAASNLDESNWERTRKSMRYDQHKSKVQQSY